MLDWCEAYGWRLVEIVLEDTRHLDLPSLMFVGVSCSDAVHRLAQSAMVGAARLGQDANEPDLTS